MADFQHTLVCEIFGVFFKGFCAQNYSNVNTESILTCFGEFKFLSQIEYFPKTIALARLDSEIFGVFSNGFLQRITPM